MALSDLTVFQEYAQSSMTEVQDQQIERFNGAVRGGLILTSAAHEGDFSSTTMWAKISGLVRRRNAYGSGAQTAKVLSQLVNTSVKVAAGTPPIEIDPGMLKWIQKSPEEAGAVIGRQMAEDSIADMLNVGIMVYVAGIGNVSALVHDGTAGTASLAALNTGASKFGDRSQDLVAWVTHSKVAFDIYGEALANNNRLFNFGNVQVVEDGFGRPIVMTDSPNLITSGSPDTYHTLGLTPGAVVVEQGNEFTDNIETSNGDENIQRTYQAEWTYQLGLKGFAWDTSTGGKSPNDAALGTAGNWDRFATSDKDLAGVLVNTQ